MSLHLKRKHLIKEFLKTFGLFLEPVTVAVPIDPVEHHIQKPIDPIERYIQNGRAAWSLGYVEYREKLVNDIVNDPTRLLPFCGGSPLPEGFGVGIDERVIEYPWVYARLG